MSETSIPKDFDPNSVISPINGDFAGKNLLSVSQLSPSDIRTYLEEAGAADKLIQHPDFRGISLLGHHVLVAVMRQPSTRTGGSMRTAMSRLGGVSGVISGMQSSSEAKGESLADSVLALAIQADVIATRTEEEFGPHYVASVQDYYHSIGKLRRIAPVINLGDGKNEHPTQTIGDLLTIEKHVLSPSGDNFSDLTITMVGNHEDYRAFHSLMIAAKVLDMAVIAVQSDVAKVPKKYRDLLGYNLEITKDLKGALVDSDVVYYGRNPDEYSGENKKAKERSNLLARDFADWRMDEEKLKLMPPNAIFMHPRPRKDEVDPIIDKDPRVVDVLQMDYMIPARMAVIALALGRSIRSASEKVFSER